MGPVRLLLLGRRLGHQQRLQGPRAVDRYGLAASLGLASIVPDRVLVVVVPSGIKAGLQHLRQQLRLPPTPASLVQRAGLVAQAKVLVVAVARLPMAERAGCGVGVSEGGPVGAAGLPGVPIAGLVPGQAERRQADPHPQPAVVQA